MMVMMTMMTNLASCLLALFLLPRQYLHYMCLLVYLAFSLVRRVLKSLLVGVGKRCFGVIGAMRCWVLYVCGQCYEAVRVSAVLCIVACGVCLTAIAATATPKIMQATAIVSYSFLIATGIVSYPFLKAHAILSYTFLKAFEMLRGLFNFIMNTWNAKKKQDGDIENPGRRRNVCNYLCNPSLWFFRSRNTQAITGEGSDSEELLASHDTSASDGEPQKVQVKQPSKQIPPKFQPHHDSSLSKTTTPRNQGKKNKSPDQKSTPKIESPSMVLRSGKVKSSDRSFEGVNRGHSPTFEAGAAAQFHRSLSGGESESAHRDGVEAMEVDSGCGDSSDVTTIEAGISSLDISPPALSQSLPAATHPSPQLLHQYYNETSEIPPQGSPLAMSASKGSPQPWIQTKGSKQVGASSKGSPQVGASPKGSAQAWGSPKGHTQAWGSPKGHTQAWGSPKGPAHAWGSPKDSPQDEASHTGFPQLGASPAVPSQVQSYQQAYNQSGSPQAWNLPSPIQPSHFQPTKPKTKLLPISNTASRYVIEHLSHPNDPGLQSLLEGVCRNVFLNVVANRERSLLGILSKFSSVLHVVSYTDDDDEVNILVAMNNPSQFQQLLQAMDDLINRTNDVTSIYPYVVKDKQMNIETCVGELQIMYTNVVVRLINNEVLFIGCGEVVKEARDQFGLLVGD